jgi:dipeptidyl aminopeptidase/acylaminoacyl peptidase
MRAAWLAGFAAFCTAASSAVAETPPCREQLLAAAGPAVPKRDIRSDDLVRLRDFGKPDPGPGDKLASLSPDQTKIALELRRADPGSNRFCMGIVVIDLAGRSPPSLVADGGDFQNYVFRTAGYGYAPSGIANAVAPAWSPDSRSLVFLKRLEGVTQAWRVTPGSPAVAVTQLPVDVEAAAWANNETIVYLSHPGLIAEQQKVEQEGASGYLFDERFDPTRSAKPRIPDTISGRYTAIDIRTQIEREATAQEQTLLRPPLRDVSSYPLSEAERLPTGDTDPANLKTRLGLRISRPGWSATCQRVACHDVLDAWLDPKSDRVLFLKRPNGPPSGTLLYSWRRGEAEPHLVLSHPGRLSGCSLAFAGLICGEETAAQPRRLVLIDTTKVRTRLLFDPNPEFAAVRLGKATALRWANPQGFKASGTLVLPPDHKTGDRVPLIVVQYQNRGFLRGGTGDEYPIYLFAAHGFAVLAINDPLPPNYLLPAADQMDAGKAAVLVSRDWFERRNVQASLEAGLRQAIALGVVDDKRLGITGFSAGGQTLEWALVHSQLFAAAAVSNCCNDQYIPIFGSQARRKRVAAANNGREDVTSEQYDQISLEHNAAQLNVPLLMQMSDDELIRGLPTYYRLDIAQKPVELYVYPGEFHNKWQPGHRAAIYQRSVDWFDFWLKGKSDPDPSKIEQYMRWEALKKRWQASMTPAQ